MTNNGQIDSQKRAQLIKLQLMHYCDFLIDQSSKDIVDMIETSTFSVADALLKSREVDDEKGRIIT